MLYFLIILLSFLGPAVLGLPLPASRRTEAANHNASDDISGINVWESNSSSGRTPNLLLRRSQASGVPYLTSTDLTRLYPRSQPNELADQPPRNLNIPPVPALSQLTPSLFSPGYLPGFTTWEKQVSSQPQSQPQPPQQSNFLSQHSQSLSYPDAPASLAIYPKPPPQSNILSHPSESSQSASSGTVARQTYPPPATSFGWSIYQPKRPNPLEPSYQATITPTEKRRPRLRACIECQRRELSLLRMKNAQTVTYTSNPPARM